MREFVRSDGAILRFQPGWKEAILRRPSANPRSSWTEEDFQRGARTKLERWNNRRSRLETFGICFEGLRVLDLACGNGIDCLLLAREPVKQVVGVDLNISLFGNNKKGRLQRQLAKAVLSNVGVESDLWTVLCQLPVCLVPGDATNLAFDDKSFDLILSKSFLEHMIPIESALMEMDRVLAPGGLMYHVIDPYYWLRGCHAPGLLDIPWAHARLSPNEYRRAVYESENEELANKKSDWQASLNHFTAQDYRRIFEDSPFEILDWRTTQSQTAVEALARQPNVLDTILDHLTPDDLVCDSVRVLARKRA